MQMQRVESRQQLSKFEREGRTNSAGGVKGERRLRRKRQNQAYENLGKLAELSLDGAELKLMADCLGALGSHGGGIH